MRIAVGTGVIVAASIIPAHRTYAQEEGGFGLGTWSGALELGFSGDRQESRTGNSTTNDFKDRLFAERLTIGNQGMYYLDPRFLTANVYLTFGMYQDNSTSNAVDTSRHGDLNGYAVDATLFADQPYNGTLFANKTQSHVTQQFGGRTDSTFENFGTVLRLREDSDLKDWGLPYLSSTLRIYQEDLNEATTSLGQTFLHSERRNGVGLDVNKGFENADLSVQYAFIDHHDNASIIPDYQTTAAGLYYNIDFGPTLNRRWDSRVTYTDRTGSNATSMLQVDELLSIDHSKKLFTSYRYLFTQLDTLSGTTTANNGILQLRHRTYENLVTSAQLMALYRNLPNGEQSSESAQLDFNYTHGLPYNGRMFAILGGRYQLNDNNIQSSRIDVTDAPFTAPSPLGGGAGFVLNQSFVDASTIVVVDTRGGARLPTVAGVDYDIVQEGNLTRIVPLPGSLVILPGDPLAVSYSYVVDPSLEWTTTTWWLNTGANFDWMSFFLSHQQTNQSAISGNPGTFLEDRRSDTVGTQLRGAWNSTREQVGAVYENYHATFLAYTRWRFNELLSYQAGVSLSVDLAAEQTHTDFTLPVRQGDSYSVLLTANWLAPGDWWTTALAGQRVYKDSLSPTDKINEAKIQTRKTYGKLTVSSWVGYSTRTRGDFEVRGWHLFMNVVRQF